MGRDGRYQRLVAEAEAWPLASLSAHAHRTLQLGHAAAGVLDGPTQKLASDLEAHLRTRSDGLSLEALRALREHSWFAVEPGSPPIASGLSLAEYLRRLAERYLASDGHHPQLRPDPAGDGITRAERAAHWRWLSLRVPADLLIAGLHATSEDEPSGDEVHLPTSHLRDVLGRPVSETHLHGGAAYSFPTLWSVWMGWFRDAWPEKLRPKDTYPFGDATGFASKLLAAAIARLFLAAFLRARELHGERGDLRAFLASTGPRLARLASWPSGAAALQREYSHALDYLQRPSGRRHDPSPSPGVLQRVYRALTGAPPTGSRREARDSSLSALFEQDPLHAWLPSVEGRPFTETRFTTRALRYLLREGQEDSGFALLFWQYQRVRCQAHAFLIEEPGTAGLDWFQVHFNRLSALRGPLEEHLAESALRHTRRGMHLGSLEMRATPEPDWVSIRDQARNLAQAHMAAPERPESALIFHFIKERELSQGRGGHARLHADPSGNSSGFRFGDWFLGRRRQALAIRTALTHHPELLLVIRGLDVASAELATPTWVTVPLLQQVRRQSRTTASHLRRLAPQWEATELHITYHAGEEFRRLVEGLRRIHELIESGILQTGDRIGHGLALGPDAPRLAELHPVAVQPAEERLDDLLWELDRYGQGQLPTQPARVERVRSEATALARELLGLSRVELDLLLLARRYRHDPQVLEYLRFPDEPEPRARMDRVLRLVWQHLTDAGVFRRGQRLVEVHNHPAETAMAAEAQAWLRSLLREREITVESNPSSNLLVLNMLGLEHHPAMALGPHLPVAHEAASAARPPEAPPPLLVSINSDDPVTFATSLADEYAHLYFALVRRGLSAHEALRWLDQLRENGWRSRFTLAASTRPDVLRQLLPPRSKLWSIEGLQPPPR
ncbi:hypothetical protein D7X55_04450 [Corallococcus sp. AB049A]|nr:hypothetical protein D7X55_04450 [Corallococcus sp. AB049A]